MSNVDISSTLNEWDSTIEKLLAAISVKDFKLFRRAYSDGCRHFRVVSTYITENEITGDIKKLILKTSNKWVKTASPLDSWKDEIGEELSSTRQKNKVRSKLSKAYFFSPSRTGKHIRRKAR